MTEEKYAACKAVVAECVEAHRALMDFLNGPLRNTNGQEWAAVEDRKKKAMRAYQEHSEAFIEAMLNPSGIAGPWYGVEIDKTKYRIDFGDETEDTVYLRIVKIQ